MVELQMASSKGSAHNLWSVDFHTQAELEDWGLRNHSIFSFRRNLEGALGDALNPATQGTYLGYCWVCDRHSHFMYRSTDTSTKDINWRESLICAGCGLGSRPRLSIHVLETTVPQLSQRSVYLTEQLTPVAAVFKSRLEKVTFSEYLGADLECGTVAANGIRHEDLTCLSFPDRSFDVVATYDVLEHVPSYRKALEEMRRVLKPGGYCFVTVPFGLGSEKNLVRARIDDSGTLHHILPPEYHGDPMKPDSGVLCYYWFGWELLGDMRNAGFQSVHIRLNWSSDYAYIGPEQPIIVGRV
jgi:SAM-dependent methyltransferase